MRPNIKDTILDKEAQKIVVKKLNSEQLFVLIVLGISSMLLYCMINKVTSQIEEINERLDKLIDLNSQNLAALKIHLIDDQKEKVIEK